MKVLHVFDHSLPMQDGYVSRSCAIIREQRNLGFDTYHLTSVKHCKINSKFERFEGLAFYRTVKSISLLYKLPVVNQIMSIFDLYMRILSIVPEIRPDIIHAHSPALNGVAALWIGKKFNIPVVYEVRAFWEDAAVDQGTSSEGGIRYKLTRYLENYVFRNADRLTTICEGLKSQIKKRPGVLGEVTVIPNAVDLHHFNKNINTDMKLINRYGLVGKFVIGFIGSFYDYEGLDTLIRSVPHIKQENPNIKVLLVGGGVEENNLKILSKELGVENEVVFTGRVPFSEIEKYYAMINILVYPRKSLRLTEIVTPLKPLEAMAQNRLFVASKVGGHCELIEDGQTGLLFDPDNPNALVEVLLTLSRDESLQERLLENARQYIEKNRTWSKSVSGYLKVYSKGYLSGEE